MKKTNTDKTIKLFVACTILVFCTLFLTVLPLGHDLHFHIYRIGAMAEELKRTSYAMPIRILSASYDNYGYGVPLFYGDLLLYVPALFSAWGVNPVTAYKLCMVTIFLLTFTSMYKMMFRCSTSGNFAFLAAVFYSFSSYYLITLCIRMSVGEAGACIFLPIVFGAFYSMLNTPPRGMQE